jgi:hypothetical protein
MPTKYTDRLNLKIDGSNNICFFTQNGLKIANGYEKIIFSNGIPYIEFSEKMLTIENICIPENQKWKVKNVLYNYVEYRSKDYCNIKIIKWKKNKEPFKSNMFYISPFKLKSNEVPILIKPLHRKKTLQNL